MRELLGAPAVVRAGCPAHAEGASEGRALKASGRTLSRAIGRTVRGGAHESS